MSDNTNTPPSVTPAQATPATTTPAPEPTPNESDNPALGKARKEAASYRERLRAAEAERDRLAEQLAYARRSLLKHTPEFGRIDPSAVDDALAELDSDALAGMFTENGDPDSTAATTTVDQIIAQKPYMARRKAQADPLVRKTGRLAENPQGAYNPKRRTLRDALHR